ncbi:Fe-hydrogenase, putative [Entamoeba nuttalli P19]|uniref:Fe-hydrogenase, putative n=1 Tax=Entamoeba nuttalli (strain P19) TaxID=1076696 RepID=K2HNE7_ENTNP|nr:Fe-hydrogenase, putative [Entamoeba nuttalli P19]EKE37395.1 Fe-hydrogenase, putative [Entamoeba nuttalli P19]|eukprot:XP_008860272.1 Fe-hydrogenase, putative [Entamoeba nuttalli P19]
MPPKPSHTITGQDHNNAIEIDWSKCMGCGMCAMRCNYGVLHKSGPKIPPTVTPNRENVTQPNDDKTRVLIDESDCVGCGQCSSACNFGAIKPVSHIERVFEAKKAGKKLVAMIAPATRVGIAEAMGLPIGTSAMAQLVHCLRLVGFDYVFDINSAADKTTMDDLAEVVEMKKEGKGPAITSCCPGWLEYLEKKYPDLIPRVSTARSPIACLAGCIKNAWCKDMKIPKEDIYTVGIMPCIAKKVESQRPNLHQDYDAALTTNEIATYFKAHLPAEECKFTPEREETLSKTEDGQCDLPFRRISGGTNIFAKTAGVAETVLRVLVKQAGLQWDPSKIQAEVMFKDNASGSAMTKLTIDIAGTPIVGVICHGGQAITKACDMMRAGELKCDVVEMMACVNGCQCGAGQPKIPPAKKADFVKRTAELDRLDDNTDIKAACENTDVLAWIDSHFDSHEQHEHLHTTYHARYPQA